MGPKIIQHDNLDKAPATGAHEREPWAREPRVLLNWQGLAVLCVSLIFAGLIVYMLLGRDLRAWIEYSWGGWVIKAALLFAALFLVKRWLLVEQPGGYKVFWLRVNEQRVIDGMLATQREWAARQYPHVAQITLTNPQAAKVEQVAPAQIIDAGPPLLPPSEWLPWFDTRPHGLLAAETGGGKSTTFKAIIKSRIERGELVFLLDPHSSDWFGLPSIGGGEDWTAVWAGMQVVIGEYTRRMQERDQYLKHNGHELPHTHFPRITVLLDEANTACRRLSIAKRGETSKWEQFAEALGSGARKVGLSIQLLAQSANVEDIGLSGPMRQNFTRICLDAATTKLMIRNEEMDASRKPDLYKALEGQAYPSTTVQSGRVVLLDRTGLDQIAPPANARAALWVDGYDRADALLSGRQIAQQPARPVVSAAATASTTVRASVPIPDAGAILKQERMEVYMIELVKRGRTRKQIRDWAVAHGLRFDNGLLTKVRSDLGLSGE